MKNRYSLVITSIITITFIGLIMPEVVNAAPIENPAGTGWQSIPSIITNISGWVRPAASLALLGSTIYGGFLRETAGADPEKVKKAMMVISSSIIGFVIIVLAPLIVSTLGAIFNLDLIA